MEFKKCRRCGCFFTSPEQVCPSCTPKDQFEMSKLRGYIQEGNITSSLTNLANSTGISLKNLNRYLENNEFSNINSMFNKEIGNLDTGL